MLLARKPQVLVVGLLAAAFLLWAGETPAAPTVRDAWDHADIARMRERSPHAVELLEQGESRAVAGAFEEALGLFKQGAAADPMSAGFFERRQCQALTSLGRREEARRICFRALEDERTPSTMAAAVRSLVAGPVAPSLEDLSSALSMLTMERSRAPGSPQLAAAMCDIATSIGDGIMLQHCADELDRIAPDYAPTRRAHAALATRCPPWRFWAGWVAIALAGFATIVHALRRAGSRRASVRLSRAGAAGGAALVACMVLGAPGAARADVPGASSSGPSEQQPVEHMLSKWPVNDKDPESSIPTEEQRNKEPLEAGYWLQDLAFKAGRASKRGEHEQAVKYYKAMYKMVPNRAISLSKLCDEYDALDRLEEARAACAGALTLDGVRVGDYAHYVHLVLRKPGTLSDKEVAALWNVVDHMKGDEDGRAAGIELQCEVAVRTGDVAKLQECTKTLAESTPNDPATLSFEWALALRQGHKEEAAKFLQDAKSAGLSDSAIKAMQDQMAADTRRENRGMLAFGVGFVILAAAGIAGFLVRNRRRAAPVPA